MPASGIRQSLFLATSLALACYPPSAVPPPVPLATESTASLGMNVTASYGYTFWDELGNESCNYINSCPGYPDGQAWALFHPTTYWDELTNGLELGILGSFGMVSFATIGGIVRYTPVRTERFRLGMQIDGGLFWVRTGMPVAVAVERRLWLWSYPALRYEGASETQSSVIEVPLGFSYLLARPGKRSVQLLFEVGYSRPTNFLYDSDWNVLPDMVLGPRQDQASFDTFHASFGFSIQPNNSKGRLAAEQRKAVEEADADSPEEGGGGDDECADMDQRSEEAAEELRRAACCGPLGQSASRTVKGEAPGWGDPVR